MYFYYKRRSHILHALHERCDQYRPIPQENLENVDGTAVRYRQANEVPLRALQACLA
jgi:hypothetical protein